MFEAEFEFMYFGRHPSYEVGPDYPVSSTGGTPVYEMTLAPEEYGYRYYDAPDKWITKNLTCRLFRY